MIIRVLCSVDNTEICLHTCLHSSALYAKKVQGSRARVNHTLATPVAERVKVVTCGKKLKFRFRKGGLKAQWST